MTDTVESVLAEMRADCSCIVGGPNHGQCHNCALADRLADAHAREVGELRAVNRRDVEMLNAWADRAKQAEARAEAAEADARRYRWLRHKLTCGHLSTDETVSVAGAKSPEVLDAAIDAHLPGGEGGGES